MRRPPAGLLLCGAVALALLAPGLRTYASVLRHRSAPGAAVAVAVGAGRSYPLPAATLPCPAGVQAEVEAALRLPVTPRCLTGPVSSRALDVWMTAHVPEGRPWQGQPWCDRQVLSDGAVLRRWGTTRTTGTLESGLLARAPWVAVLSQAPPCG